MATSDAGTKPPGQSVKRSTNLTREDAAKRASAITEVGTYQIDLDLTDGNGRPGGDKFRSTTTVTFEATAGEQTFIDIVPGPSGALRRATLNGFDIQVGGYDEDQGITLTDLAEDNTVVVEADCTYSHDGEGLYRFEDPAEQEVYLYTQFETAAAKRVFACFDQPDLKAVFSLTVRVPDHWSVISNTTATSGRRNHQVAQVRPHGADQHLSIRPDRRPVLHAGRTPTPTKSGKPIPLRIFSRKSLQQYLDAEHLFDLTKQGFTFYHNTFGVNYPFGKYDQVFCPAYNAGAMENVAAVTFTEDYVFRGHVTRYQKAQRAETLVHEMAHMWFGDLVTMKWWDDLWLNESFATWASNLCLANATQFSEAWTTFANVAEGRQPTGKISFRRLTRWPTTWPTSTSSLANFDPITYIKGASALKQLVAYIGRRPLPSRARHEYFTTHAYGNAELDDLLTALATSDPRPRSARTGPSNGSKRTGSTRYAPTSTSATTSSPASQ